MWSVHKHACLSRGGRKRVAEDQAVRRRMTRPRVETVRDRWIGRQTDRVSPLRAVQRQVGKSITKHVTHACAARGTWKCCSVFAGAECLCLLSKWSCLCLKVDWRLVLSLETGALISVWLCWLSFSSISTVQQEKPCGHTLSGAPARHGTLMLVNAEERMTNIKNTFSQNQPATQFHYSYILGQHHYQFKHIIVD